MAEPRSRRVVHADLTAGLPTLAAGDDGRPLHVIWWWQGVPVGQDELGPHGLPPRALADRAARRVAEHEAAAGESAAGGGPALAVAVRAGSPAALERCLAALLGDAEPPAEVVVVDCGSADAVRAAAERFKGVRVLPAAGAGEGAARNLAVAATTSEVVAFLADDAEVRPGWSARIRAPFADDAVVAVTGLELPLELETDAQVAHETLLAGPGRRYSPGALAPARGPLDGPLAVRRRALELAGPFDEALGQGTGAELLARIPGGVRAHAPAAAVLAPPPRDAAELRRRARERRRGAAAAGLAGGEPREAARAALAEPAVLALTAARELLRRAAGGSGLTPRAAARPVGAELRGQLEGLVHAAGGARRRAGARGKAPLREFLARNPFPHPLTEGFFYREKMRAVHRVAPDVALGRVLEIGGGRSGMARKLFPGAHVTSTDLDPVHAGAFGDDPQTTFMVADATALPFEDGSFDAVTLLDVLEHIPDDVAAAREAWRVVRPAGWVIVSSPNLRWRSPYHAVMRPICPTSEDMIARWQHVRIGYEHEDLERLFGAPPATTADFINPVTVIAHDLAFSHLPSRLRRVLLAALSPVTWMGYALQRPGARGTETAASWRKPAP